MWIRVYDQSQQSTVVDQFTVPVSFLTPFQPANMEVKLANSSAKIYLTILLDMNDNKERQDDDILTINFKWVDFNPIPHASAQMYSCWLAPCGFQIGQVLPWLKCDTQDAPSISRAFFTQRQVNESTRKGKPPAIHQRTNYLSRALPFIPAATNSLFEFKVPMSCIETLEEMALYIVAQADSQLTPMTIVGSTGPISARLSAWIYSGKSTSQSDFLSVKFPGADVKTSHEATVLCSNFMHVSAKVEVFLTAPASLQRFVNDKGAYPTQQVTQAPTKERGTYDMLNNRERWQLLSKELA